MAAASLVLGIISLVFMFIPYVGYVGGVLGIIGIILGALGRKDPAKKGMATGGLVCSIIGTVICWIGAIIACIGCGILSSMF